MKYSDVVQTDLQTGPAREIMSKMIKPCVQLGIRASVPGGVRAKTCSRIDPRSPQASAIDRLSTADSIHGGQLHDGDDHDQSNYSWRRGYNVGFNTLNPGWLNARIV